MMPSGSNLFLTILIILHKFALMCDGAGRGGRRGIGSGVRTSDVVYFKCSLSEVSYATQVSHVFVDPTNRNSKMRCEGTVHVKACQGNCPSSEMWSIKRGLTRVCRCCDINSNQSVNVILRSCRDYAGRLLQGVLRSTKVSVPESCGCTRCSSSSTSGISS